MKLSRQYPQFQPEANALLDICNKNGFPAPGRINAEKLWDLAGEHQVRPRIFKELENNKGCFPDKVYSDFKYDYLTNLARNRTFWKEFIAISRRMGESRIMMVPIKGVDILARFYPESDSRFMVDIDLLVKTDDFERAETVLLEMGYKKALSGFKEAYWKNKQCHLAFIKGELMVELHWGLDFNRGHKLLPGLWQRTKEVSARLPEV